MKILETERTILREIVADDAAFMLDLLNQPSFIKYIGDRNVRDLRQAREFIEHRLRASYQNFGYGLWTVELRETGELVGICGFVKRDVLPDADIGFAFLPDFEGKGYAFEAAAATLKYGREKLNFGRVLAITSPDNERSGRLLEKIGLRFERTMQLAADAADVKLYSIGE